MATWARTDQCATFGRDTRSLPPGAWGAEGPRREVGEGQGEPAAGREPLLRLKQEPAWIEHVLEHIGEQDDVEAAAGERQPVRQIRLHELGELQLRILA